MHQGQAFALELSQSDKQAHEILIVHTQILTKSLAIELRRFLQSCQIDGIGQDRQLVLDIRELVPSALLPGLGMERRPAWLSDR